VGSSSSRCRDGGVHNRSRPKQKALLFQQALYLFEDAAPDGLAAGLHAIDANVR